MVCRVQRHKNGGVLVKTRSSEEEARNQCNGTNCDGNSAPPAPVSNQSYSPILKTCSSPQPRVQKTILSWLSREIFAIKVFHQQGARPTENQNGMLTLVQSPFNTQSFVLPRGPGKNTGRPEEVGAKIPVAIKEHLKVVLPIQDLWSRSLSDTWTPQFQEKHTLCCPPQKGSHFDHQNDGRQKRKMCLRPPYPHVFEFLHVVQSNGCFPLRKQRSRSRT